MLSTDHLRDLISTNALSNADKVLLSLAVEPDTPKAVKEITSLAFDNGFRRIKKVNVSDILSKTNGLAVRVSQGWKLSNHGIKHVQQIAGPLMSSPVPKAASALRIHLPDLNKQTAAFVEEAILCFEMRQFRAATVLSWVGAVSLLYDHVIKNELSTFNAAATKQFANSKTPWQPAKNADDLARMKDADFLVVLEKTSVIGKTVKQQLEAGLKLRNGCGHPNSYNLGEHKVSAHIEDLILNVFSKFG